jgi:hypothetical protein
MDCPHCIRYIPALAAMTAKLKLDKRSRFSLQDHSGNVYIFKVYVKKDINALRDLEIYFNSQSISDYICKIGVKDKQLALLYISKDFYINNKKNYFKHKILV